MGLRGICLAPAARVVAPARSRGRHGLALQWHLGLAAHDPSPLPDWEERIEVKLLTVWRRSDGTLASDKVKICEASSDPNAKLANVLWVLADHATRVVVGHTYTVLAGPMRAELESSWYEDPHFGEPTIYVESRDSGRACSPAYYLTPSFVSKHVLAPMGPLSGVFEHTSSLAASAQARAAFGLEDRASAAAMTTGPDTYSSAGSLQAPALVADAHSLSPSDPVRCPSCTGELLVTGQDLAQRGVLFAAHRLARGCPHPWVRVVDQSALVPATICSRSEQIDLVVDRVPLASIWRVSDRVLEPEDHLHD